MKTNLQIESVHLGPQMLVLRLSGDLDSRGAPALMTHWRTTLKPGQGTLINLSGVLFASSSGVGSLMAIVEESNDAGTPVFLVGVTPNVLAVIRLLGLEKFMPLRPTEESALAA